MDTLPAESVAAGVTPALSDAWRCTEHNLRPKVANALVRAAAAPLGTLQHQNASTHGSVEGSLALRAHRVKVYYKEVGD